MVGGTCLSRLLGARSLEWPLPALPDPLSSSLSAALVLGFDWGKFLKDHSYKAAPVSCFKHVSAGGREGAGSQGSPPTSPAACRLVRLELALAPESGGGGGLLGGGSQLCSSFTSLFPLQKSSLRPP